jgi:hypothetical protein
MSNGTYIRFSNEYKITSIKKDDYLIDGCWIALLVNNKIFDLLTLYKSSNNNIILRIMSLKIQIEGNNLDELKSRITKSLILDNIDNIKSVYVNNGIENNDLTIIQSLLNITSAEAYKLQENGSYLRKLIIQNPDSIEIINFNNLLIAC